MMFLDNLSISILKLCDEYQLTYEAASERCDISSRYFGDIARRKTTPTIATLEKICNGFHLMPNDLLVFTRLQSELSYRQPVFITECFTFDSPYGSYFYPVCPRCHTTMDKEFQSYCDRCGQKLDWNRFHI